MSSHAAATSEPPGSGRAPLVIASGVTGKPVSGDGPVEDYVLLGHLFDAEFVDPAEVVTGRITRLIDRVVGSSWLVARECLRRAVRRSAPVVAMGDDVGVPLAVLARVRRKRPPLIVICQHLRSRKAKLFLGRLRCGNVVDLFFAMSTEHAAILREELHVPPDKVEMLYDTVDHRFFSMDPSVEVRRQIASAGMAARDYKTLIEATRGLDVDVKIEANSAWYDSEQNFTPEDLHDRVELCDDGTTVGLRGIYAASSIVVVPIRDVDYSAGYTTILEAMSMGKPVIATATRLPGNFIVDGESGLFYAPGDVEGLRAHIQRLLDDPVAREQMGRAARARIESEFTRDAFAQRLAAGIARVTRT